MVCTWSTHGLHMVYTRSTHGLHMVYAWSTHGLHMVYTWSTHGLHMVYTWSTHGLHMVYTWSTHGLHLVYTWSMHGLRIVMRRDPKLSRGHAFGKKNVRKRDTDPQKLLFDMYGDILYNMKLHVAYVGACHVCVILTNICQGICT